MAKFMCTHTVPPGAFTTEQIRKFAQAAQQDPTAKGYRSFANLAEGKAVCIMEAPGKDAVAAWFTKMGMPFDTITKVELEGHRGSIQSACSLLEGTGTTQEWSLSLHGALPRGGWS